MGLARKSLAVRAGCLPTKFQLRTACLVRSMVHRFRVEVGGRELLLSVGKSALQVNALL